MNIQRGLTAAAASSLMAMVATPALAQFDLQITEMWMGNEPGDNLSSDWIEIVNVGDQPWVAGIDGDLFYDDESMDADAADPIMGIDAIDPGEAVVVIIDVGDPVIDEFVNLWTPAYMIEGVQIGTVDGSGLGQGGDGATLFVGGPTMETIVDFEEYPDADANGGQSWDVLDGAFSIVGNAQDAAATVNVNDEGQPAIASPGNLGAVGMLGEAPVITLNGDSQIVLNLDDPFEDPGAIALDAEDGDISEDIVVSGDVVDTGVFGAYTIAYDVTDSDGNPAPTVTRDVIVTYPETIPPAPEDLAPSLFTQVATLGGLLGAEIPAYDSVSSQAYVTSGDGLQIIDLSDPAAPQVVGLIDPSADPISLGNTEVTSVDSCDGILAVRNRADHFNRVKGFQEGAHAFRDQRMIIGDENLHHGRLDQREGHARLRSGLSDAADTPLTT
ncbi:MAG: immunoglobulin-like domain-containing protein [Pseudomonadota bacterium]